MQLAERHVSTEGNQGPCISLKLDASVEIMHCSGYFFRKEDDKQVVSWYMPGVEYSCQTSPAIPETVYLSGGVSRSG